MKLEDTRIKQVILMENTSMAQSFRSTSLRMMVSIVQIQMDTADITFQQGGVPELSISMGYLIYSTPRSSTDQCAMSWLDVY